MVISQAIVSIKKGLPDPEGAEKSEEFAHKFLGIMLDEVRMVDSGRLSNLFTRLLKTFRL